MVILMVGGTIWWITNAFRSGKVQAFLDRQTNPDWVPAAQYYLADWYFLLNDLTQATTGYWRVMERFPTSSFAERAHFSFLDALDQMHISRSYVRQEYEKFLEKYPESAYAKVVRKRLELFW